MSENHPPYGGQPDPNAAAWGTPPGSPVAPSAYGHPQPGYPGQPGQPPYGAPVPSPQKSNKGLIVGLGIGAVVMAVLVACGGTIGYFALRGDEEPTPTASASSAAPAPTDGAPSAPAPPAEPQPNNNAVTAQSSSDLSAVCDGSPILNAASYTGPKGAKVITFANSPDRPSSWRSQSAGYGKPYYAKPSDWATVSVVGCMALVEGSEGAPRKCDYKDNDGKTVTIDYVSSRYTLTFHNAKTGEKIADGGTVNAPAVRCPSFVAYNKATMKAYARPDDGALELALDKFTS